MIDLPYPQIDMWRNREEGATFFHNQFPHIVVATSGRLNSEVHEWLTANVGAMGGLNWSFTRGWHIFPEDARWSSRGIGGYFLADAETAVLLKLTFEHVALRDRDDPEWRIWPD